MKYVLDGCSRFTGCRLQLELDAECVSEAIERAQRLGLVEVEAHEQGEQPIMQPPDGAARGGNGGRTRPRPKGKRARAQ